MSFTSPYALLLLLTLPAIFWLGRPRPTAPRKGRAWTSLVLRLTLLILLILAFAGMQTVRSADELAVVFLVDGSDSINAEQASQAEQFVREAIETMQINDSAAVVVFGSNALVERPMSKISELSRIASLPQTLHTDLAEAIRLGLALFPAGSARRLVVLSDGAATIGDTPSAGRLAAANGVQIDYVPLLREETAVEAWLTDVSAPTRASLGEIFALDIAAQSTADTSATLRVIAGGQIVSEQTVQLRSGLNNYTIRLEATAQEFTRYTVQLTPDQDTFYQNNQLSTYTEIVGPPRILLVSSDGTVDDSGVPYPEEALQLQSALEAAGLLVDRITPADLPSNFADLSNYASVVMVNINAKRLTPRKMEALQIYVRDLGGGLVMVGGPESYAMGGYFRTPLEAALPVNMQIEDEERFPSVSIVIVIDRSGSMGASEGGLTKIQLAAEGAVRVVELLNDFDEITVIPVDTQPTGQVGPFPASERAESIRRIREIGAGGGGIYVFTGMEAAADALAQSDNQVKHIIVLADGSDAEEKNGVPELIDDLTGEGVTISMVSIGNGSDMPWLQEMAERGNGRFHFTDRAANLPQIFTQETTSIQRSYLVEEQFFPELGRQSPILSGIEQVPALNGYVGTSAKGTAQVVLETHLGDPLLATWQYGLGRSVAWTSDVSGRWAGSWVAWEGFPSFWAQTVRWTVSEGRNSAVETVVDLQGEQAELVVDARSPQGDFLNGLEVEASIVSPSGESEPLLMQQIAPGRYASNFVPKEEGAYFIRVAGGDGTEDTIIGQTSGWVLGYSPEYQQFEAQPQVLAALAEQTGGRDLGGVIEAVFEHNLPSESSARPLWPTLLLLAVILLPFDIGVRRIVISRSDWQRAWAATGGRFAAQPAVEQPRSPEMAGLFQAKQRAQQKHEAESASGGSLADRLRRAPTADGENATGRADAPVRPISIPRPEPPKREGDDASSETAGANTLASRLLKKKRDQQNDAD